MTITVHQAGPLVTVQDLGRPCHVADGLSPGGAMDRLALVEAAAILGLPGPVAAIEMAGTGGVFSTDTSVRFALTGAPMQARIGDQAIGWNCGHVLHPGQRLTVGGVLKGSYGYLTLAGGVCGQRWLDSCAAHLSARIGRPLLAGDHLATGPDTAPDLPPRRLDVADRFSGGVLRLMPGPQTSLFDTENRARFAATAFRRGMQANRQGARLDHDGPVFSVSDAGRLQSDYVVCGDVQMIGEGVPYVLLRECQTTGGYPRIGTVIAADLPSLVQAPGGAVLRFAWVTTETADQGYRSDMQICEDLRRFAGPARRDPADIADLLAYQLISGAIAGNEQEDPT